MLPRAEGHCFAHHVPGACNRDVTHHCDAYDSDELYTMKDPLGAALKYLRTKQADLRRGDLIIFDDESSYRNRNIRIFNGEYIIELEPDKAGYRKLPSQFRVIEGNVPITYWDDIDSEDPTEEGISQYTVVWFNHVPVRDQCLENMWYGRIEDGEYAVFTTFTYKDQGEYRIIFDYTGTISCNSGTYEIPRIVAKTVLQCFREYLESDDLIPFETDGFGYSGNGRTLFLLPDK